MVNDKSKNNLISLKDRTPEERHIIALKGAKTKADNYKRHLHFRQFLYAILNEEITVNDAGQTYTMTKKEYLSRLLIKRTLQQLDNDNIEKLDEYNLAQLMYLLEIQTAIAGELYNINAFDHPGVEQSNNYVYGLMGRLGYEGSADEIRAKISQ